MRYHFCVQDGILRNVIVCILKARWNSLDVLGQALVLGRKLLRGFVDVSWLSSACLIGDDEPGGASGRVRCIGVRSVRASKQWAQEDGSKIKDWLAQHNHKRRDGQVFQTVQRSICGICSRQLCSNNSKRCTIDETTSSARPHIQKHLGNGEPRSFQQTGAGPRIFHRLERYWPGLPEIARPCWQRKSAQGGPLEKEKRCKAHCVQSGCKLERASGHM